MTTAGTTSGAGTATGASVNNASSGSKAGNTKSTSAPKTGLFSGLVAFLSAAGGLAFLFLFLILLALILFVIGVAGWLRRRESRGWGAHFARVTHRA